MRAQIMYNQNKELRAAVGHNWPGTDGPILKKLFNGSQLV